jgi:hypothetical protein
MEIFDTQMNNLYSEDDFLRRASQKAIAAKGFDRKAFNEALYSKEKQVTDSAIGHTIPVSYYEWTDDGFEPEGGMAAPPSGSNANSFLQTESKQANTLEKRSLQHYIREIISGAKKSLYQGYTESPIWIRDAIIRYASKKSRFLDFVTSLYQMGSDIGPIQRMRTDFFHDTLEMIINEHGELLAMRIYNTRPSTPLTNFLLEGGPIQYHGTPAKKEDLNYTPGGLIVYKKTCGGEPMNIQSVQYDEAYSKLGTLKFVSHGEVLKPGLNTRPLENNLKEFAVSYFINERKDLWDELQPHTETKEMIYRITLPKGWGLSGFDSGLMMETALYSIGAAAMLHTPFWLGEQFYKLLRLDPKVIEDRELAALYIPSKRLITRGM